MQRQSRSRQEELESPEHIAEEGEPTSGGRAGGELQKKKGTKDEMKRARERPAGATRVRKQDKKSVDTTPRGRP